MNLKYFYTVSLGLFIALGLTVMGRMALYLRTSYSKESREIQVLFNNIERIRIGTRVSYAGKTIGEITRVEFPDNYRNIYINDQLYPFKVTFNVDKQIPLYDTDIIKPVTSGLMGEKTITILPHTTTESQEVDYENHHFIIKPELGINELVQVATETTYELKKSIEVIHETLETDFKQTTQSINEISSTVNKTLKTMFTSESINLTLDNLLESSEKIKEFVTDLNKDNVTENIKSVIANIESSTNNISNLLDKSNKFLETIDESSLNITDSISHILSDVNNLIEGLNNITSVNNRSELNEILVNVREVSRDLSTYGLLYGNNKKWKAQKKKDEKEIKELLGKDINKAKLQSVMNEIKSRNKVIRNRLNNTKNESDFYSDEDIVGLIEDYETLTLYLTEVTS
ncbi:MlaD family protein [Chlamydiia bacterium]|nr:MlaD family protein [Chlamydiia bacterium]MDA8773892.1 MlaD family protein [Chlamydiia bacterium]